jgi:predicted secreted protein
VVLRRSPKESPMLERHPSSRRSFLAGVAAHAVGAVLAGRALLAPAALRAAPPDEDEIPEGTRKVLQARFGGRPLRKGRVQLDVPENAPDGRSVPVFIETDLPMGADDYVKAFHLLVDHNPDIYLAGFQLTPALGAASIDTRIKMRRTSYVRAIAETSRGELWTAATKVYVTLNGCG